MAILPTSINTIDYFTPAAGSVTITNQTAALTVKSLTRPSTIGQSLTVGQLVRHRVSMTPSPLSSATPTTSALCGQQRWRCAGRHQCVRRRTVHTHVCGRGQRRGRSPTGATTSAEHSWCRRLVETKQVTISGDTTLQMDVTPGHNGVGAIRIRWPGLTCYPQSEQPLGRYHQYCSNGVGRGNGWELLLFVTMQGPISRNLSRKSPRSATYSNNAVKIDASASGGLISPWGDANFVGTRATPSSAPPTRWVTRPPPVLAASCSVTCLLVRPAMTSSPARA